MRNLKTTKKAPQAKPTPPGANRLAPTVKPVPASQIAQLKRTAKGS